jgi:cholesterol oxidase
MGGGPCSPLGLGLPVPPPAPASSPSTDAESASTSRDGRGQRLAALLQQFLQRKLAAAAARVPVRPDANPQDMSPATTSSAADSGARPPPKVYAPYTAAAATARTAIPASWPWLALPVGALKPRYDVVVIGSGYGASVAASRLSRAGKTVCVLELGKERVPGEYPHSPEQVWPEVKLTLPDGSVWPQNNVTGFYDFTISQNVLVWKGCGLGGGSLVNSSVAIRPDYRIFLSWPAEFSQDATLLEQAFALALQVLSPAQYPDQATKPLPQSTLLVKAAGEQPSSVSLVNSNTTFRDRVNAQGVPQSACTLCGDCNTGCNYTSKNTLLMNYLPDAHQHGAEMFVTMRVLYLEKTSDDQWTVHAEYLGDESKAPVPMKISCGLVVLGAGSLGSTEILLRSKQQGLAVSNYVGQRFGADGDFFAVSYNGPDNANGVGIG